MLSYQGLIKRNKQWVEKTLNTDPHYFETLSKGQSPEWMFICCSDSRKPINIITQTAPGDLFIIRNIANQVSTEDMGSLSGVYYAVNELKVSHIVVCGHEGCGGIKAAMSEKEVEGPVGKWIAPIRKLYFQHKDKLDLIANTKDRENTLSELNVRQQVKNLHDSSIIKEAKLEGTAPLIHGWMFCLESGLIHPLDIS